MHSIHQPINKTATINRNLSKHFKNQVSTVILTEVIIRSAIHQIQIVILLPSTEYNAGHLFESVHFENVVSDESLMKLQWLGCIIIYKEMCSHCSRNICRSDV